MSLWDWVLEFSYYNIFFLISHLFFPDIFYYFINNANQNLATLLVLDPVLNCCINSISLPK